MFSCDAAFFVRDDVFSCWSSSDCTHWLPSCLCDMFWFYSAWHFVILCTQRPFHWSRFDCISWMSNFSCDMFWIHDLGSECDTNHMLLIHSSCRAWMASEGCRKMTAIFFDVSVSGSSSDGRCVKTVMARISLGILSKSAWKVNLVCCHWLNYFLWVMMHGFVNEGRWRVTQYFHVLFQNRFFDWWMFLLKQ